MMVLYEQALLVCFITFPLLFAVLLMKPYVSLAVPSSRFKLFPVCQLCIAKAIFMKPGLLLFANTLTLLGTLLINYLGGTGNLNGPSIGEVSDRYPTLITPAGYAFSIWGLIYFLLLAFVAYQWHAYFHDRNQESLNKAGIWFSLANIANGLWVIAWTNEALGFSVMLIFLLLFFLVLLVLRLRLEIWDAPLRMIAFVWWPVCIYIGWIILAVVINVAVYLKKIAVLKGICLQRPGL
jgi:hypothetical protein